MATVAGGQTRSALIRAAEHLMARQGIEAAEFKDILAAAGQRNRAAIHYYFGNRAGLVHAIGETHRAEINIVRNRHLDRLERGGELSISSLAGALVHPLAAELSDPSGRDYIVILAEAVGRLGTTALYRADRPFTDSVRRLTVLLEAHLAGSAAARRVRIGQAELTTAVLLADVARSVNVGELTDRRARPRVRGIVDFVSGALSIVPNHSSTSLDAHRPVNGIGSSPG